MAKKTSPLHTQVVQDIHDFLLRDVQPLTNGAKGWHRPFYSEAELQHGLAEYLKQQGRYSNIYLEYSVPEFTCKGVTIKKAKVDIVVEKDGEYVPIELKFKTKEPKPANGFKPHDYTFGEKSLPMIFKDEVAHTDSLRDFWRDVKRVMYMDLNYPNVKGAIVLMLTNAPYYWTNTNSLYNIVPGVNKQPPAGEVQVFSSMVNISLPKPVAIDWFDAGFLPLSLPQSQFRYCIVEV